MDKLTRGIDKEFAEVFKSTAAFDLLIKHPDELFLGIRNNYINIYYRGSSICKGNVVDGRFKVKIAKRYLDLNAGEGYKIISADDLKNEYKNIKSNIDNKYAVKNKEKDAQQRLVNNNNGNPDSEWVCVDIEYKRQRKKKSEKDPGRFDIIAVTKTAPHRVALIELKRGTGSIGGNSGIVKHAKDYREFLKSGKFEKHLLPELAYMIRSYLMLFPDYPLAEALSEKNKFSTTPEFYFITLENTGDRARKTMLRYIRKYEPEIYKDNFNPVFLFSEDNGKSIKQIIGDSNYQERWTK